MLRRVRHVRFDVGPIQVHEVTPYSEIYGAHPSDFDFDRCGDVVLTWEAFERSIGIEDDQAKPHGTVNAWRPVSARKRKSSYHHRPESVATPLNIREQERSPPN